MICKIDHVVITTSDAPSCLTFYRKLGFEVHDAGGRYELHAGNFKINVHLFGKELEPHAGKIQPGSADLCFEIDGNLEELRTDLTAKGLEILMGIVSRTGVKGPMQSIYLRDPDGNLVEFCRYE